MANLHNLLSDGGMEVRRGRKERERKRDRVSEK